MNENTKKYFKIGVLVASVIVIIATFLPYLSTMGVGISLTLPLGKLGDGIILVIFGVLAIVCALLNKALPTLVVSVAAFVMWIFEMVQAARVALIASKAIGYWLLLIGAIALLVLSVLYFLADRKSKN